MDEQKQNQLIMEQMCPVPVQYALVRIFGPSRGVWFSAVLQFYGQDEYGRWDEGRAGSKIPFLCVKNLGFSERKHELYIKEFHKMGFLDRAPSEKGLYQIDFEALSDHIEKQEGATNENR